MPENLIRFIRSEELLSLRQQVLKPKLTRLQCRMPGDDDDTSFHVGLFFKNRLVSIATFMAEAHPELKGYHHPFRLRGMATDQEFQGQGFGAQVLNFGETTVRDRGGDFIWFNAREVAFPFYEKLGFEFSGPMFDIPDVGPHKVMYKVLKSR